MVKLFLFFIFFPLFIVAEESMISLNINSAATSQKSKLKIIILDELNETVSIAQRLKQMLERAQCKTSGFSVDIAKIDSHDKPSIKKYLQHWNNECCVAALFLNNDSDNFFQWRLYDTQTHDLIQGKKFQKLSDHRLNAEHLADAIWKLLLDQDGFFSTRIALCKEIKTKSGRTSKEIYVTMPYSDYTDTELSKKLVANTNAFALHWNENIQNPLLFYSEITSANVRLMSVSPDGKRRLVSNFDGMNIFPSASSDGQKVVYCISQNGKTQLFQYEWNPLQQNAGLRQLTSVGNNISPTLLDNGDIIFCSDAQGKPAIVYYHAFSKTTDYLTDGGFCTSPSFCKKLNKIIYSKQINGTMQLWIYDMINKTHHQLTTDAGDKEDCCWSPCGNYVVFSVDTGKSSRIAIQNLITSERHYITPENQRYCYPVWSPAYENPIIV